MLQSNMQLHSLISSHKTWKRIFILFIVGLFGLSKSCDALISGQRNRFILSSPKKRIQNVKITRVSHQKKSRTYSSILMSDVQKDTNDIDEETLPTVYSLDNVGTTIVDTVTQQPLLFTAFVTLTLMLVMAKLGLLGQEYLFQPQLILHDFGATILTLVLSAAFVKLLTYLVKVDLMEPRDSRKTIHTLSAPLFMLVWPIFSHTSSARFFATIVPLLNLVRLLLAGAGGEKGGEEDLAKAVSRSGDAGEALGGPFIYVIVLLLSTLGFWTNNLVGVTAVSIMSIGDGLADLVGRRLGKNNKWSFSPNKSIAGTLAFVIGSAVGSILLASWLSYTGTMVLPFPMASLAARLFVICTICGIVELFPVVDDNVSVPLTAVVLSSLLLQ